MIDMIVSRYRCNICGISLHFFVYHVLCVRVSDTYLTLELPWESSRENYTYSRSIRVRLCMLF